MAECTRVEATKGEVTVTVEDVKSLVNACAAAFSSTAVFERFLGTFSSICYRKPSNHALAVDAGVIAAIVAAMGSYGAANARVASEGCSALHSMVREATNSDRGAAWLRRNADALVLSTGGLDAILAAMRTHATDERVQFMACEALYNIFTHASPAALRVILESRAVELLRTARANFPEEGFLCTVDCWVVMSLRTLGDRMSELR